MIRRLSQSATQAPTLFLDRTGDLANLHLLDNEGLQLRIARFI